ncbi:MAG: peptidoglycan -binding protein [Rhodospirillales bacterium]
MAGFAMRRHRRAINVWPGWVDALATLVMVVMFLLMVFMVAQFYLREALSGRDSQLKQLSGQIGEIAELLSMERQSSADLRAMLARLSGQLQASIAERDDLSNRLGQMTARVEAAETAAWRTEQRLAEANKTIAADRETIELRLRDLAALQAAREELARKLAEESLKLRTAEQQTQQAQQSLAQTMRTVEAGRQRIESLGQGLEAEKAAGAKARDELALMNQQIAALREQLARLNAALEASEAKDKAAQAQIADLGKRLNVALASKVQELARYRSEFFGKLREALGDRPDIRVVGDRFVFQSEVLFDSGSAQIGEPGPPQLARLAATLKLLAVKIPPDINWVLRVDGHTDRVPIATSQFPSNWELSTARALSVVRFLQGEGISPERLAAAGFGEHQPLDARDDEIGRRRNRRIELKFDQR